MKTNTLLNAFFFPKLLFESTFDMQKQEFGLFTLRLKGVAINALSSLMV